jgi:hypothetical protein
VIAGRRSIPNDERVDADQNDADRRSSLLFALSLLLCAAPAIAAAAAQ